jgi:hypothetical protein
LWLRAANDPFLSDTMVRAAVEASGARFEVVDIADVDDLARAEEAFRVIDERIEATAPDVVVATGDGAIVHPLRSRLEGRDVRIECFFRNPEKKSGAS